MNYCRVFTLGCVVIFISASSKADEPNSNDLNQSIRALFKEYYETYLPPEVKDETDFEKHAQRHVTASQSLHRTFENIRMLQELENSYEPIPSTPSRYQGPEDRVSDSEKILKMASPDLMRENQRIIDDYPDLDVKISYFLSRVLNPLMVRASPDYTPYFTTYSAGDFWKVGEIPATAGYQLRRIGKQGVPKINELVEKLKAIHSRHFPNGELPENADKTLRLMEQDLSYTINALGSISRTNVSEENSVLEPWYTLPKVVDKNYYCQ